MSNLVILIPARGGSKGLKNKNYLDLGGKPLLQHTVELAKEFVENHMIYVSSDSDHILTLARTLGVNPIKKETRSFLR